MNKFTKWAERQHNPQKRLLAIAFMSVPFLIVPVLLLGFLAPAIDRWLHLSSWYDGFWNPLVGLLILVPGWGLAVWTIHAQFTQAQGTPAPIMATQKLLVQGPYTYCRNPMALGTILFFLGIAVWVGSLSAVALVLLFTAVLITYVKTVEEKELVERFGSAYSEYRQNTPFLIPHPGKLRRSV